MTHGILEHYRDWMPVEANTKIVSLGEGSTPLIFAEKISEMVGSEVFLKFDGTNPTGSFKDRGMTLAITKALESGSKAVVCASTGNTSASAAAYAAQAGMSCVVLIPHGNVALGKLAQAYTYGANVIQIDGNFDDALTIVRQLGETLPMTIVNSINPYRIEGQKSSAFEIIDELSDAPEVLCIPVGNGGNISAYWRGFQEFNGAGKSTRLPIMLGFQAEGAAPLVTGKPVANPDTVASAIRIGNPASWDSAMSAASSSGGQIRAVTDQEILDAQKLIASTTGVFCEPASAASVAGLLKYGAASAPRVVCVLTGNGLKDPDAVLNNLEKPALVQPTLEDVEAAISGAF